MLKPLALAMIGFVAFSAAGPSLAQGLQPPAVSIEQATKMARERGLVLIREIELDDGKWEVEGRNPSGERRELHIDASTGKVLRDERD